MTKRQLTAIIIALALILAAGITAYAVSTAYGSREDPLITKSYLDEVVQPELEKTVQAELEKALSEVKAGNGEFTLLTLKNGQTVTCAVGTELLLRFGTARAYAYDSADVALVDTTNASTVMGGAALSANHLYMVTILGNGFTAAADNTKVLVCGTYTIS